MTGEVDANKAAKVFVSYSNADEELWKKLEEHLSSLYREGVITIWHVRQVEAGTEWEQEVATRLRTADIILLLVSPSFLHSDVCWNTGHRAMEQHGMGTCVIPINLRPADWTGAPFANLQASPGGGEDSQAITTWNNQDEAFWKVAQDIRIAAKRIKSTSPPPPPPSPSPPPSPPSPSPSPSPLIVLPFTRVPLWGSALILLVGVGIGVLMAETLQSRSTHEFIGTTASSTGRCAVSADDVTAIDFSPDGKYVAVASSDHTVRVSEVNETTITETACDERHSDGVVAVKFAPNGDYLATASLDGTAGLWKISSTGTLSALDSLQCPRYLRDPAQRHALAAIDFHPDGKHVAMGCADSSIQVWDITNPQDPIATLKRNTYVIAVSFSADGQYIAGANLNSPAFVWNWDGDRDGKKVMNLPAQGATVVNADFSPQQSQYLASASADGTIQLWDINTPNQALAFRKRDTSIASVHFSPDGRYIVTTSLDNKANVWDWETNQTAISLLGQEQNVVATAFSPDGQYLATASADNPDTPNHVDGTVKIWDLKSGREVKQLLDAPQSSEQKSPVNHFVAIAFHPEEDYLAIGRADGTLEIWDWDA